jgi:hypothetical protein
MRMRILGGIGVLIAGSIAATALASTHTAHKQSAPSAPASSAKAAAGQAGVHVRASRATHYRNLAHAEIVRRQAALHGRRIAADTPPDPTALAAIRDMVIEMASLNGVPSPANGRVYSSTRQTAENLISRDTVDTDQPVYVALVSGNFVGYLASVPTSGQFPTGRAMTIVFDATTLAVTDWGLDEQVPDLTPLGLSVPLGS